VERGAHLSSAHCGFASCIGGVVNDPCSLLMRSPEGFREHYGAHVMLRCEVTGLNREDKTISGISRENGDCFSLSYDKLVIATGSSPVLPSIQGIDDPRIFMLRSYEDMLAIRTAIQSSGVRRAIVVGGGCVGLEAAESLARRGVITGLAEASDHLLPELDADMAKFAVLALEQHGVALGIGTSVTSVEDAGEQGLRVRFSDGPDAFADIVVIAAGVHPETALAQQAGIVIGPSGGIVVDECQRTSDGNIWAVGDAAEVKGALGRAVAAYASAAARQAHVAADSICGIPSRYEGTLGVFSLALFDTQIGSVGFSEARLKAACIPYEKVFTRAASRAAYYPGANDIVVKLLFDPRSGIVLGAQLAGGSGVDRRIDVLATAIRAGFTAEDLCGLELCSAPPFGAAKDVVNLAGYAAQNVVRGLSRIIHWQDALRTGRLLLDVRTSKEYAAGTLPGAINIPIETLRDRLQELPENNPVLCFSGTGERGYSAERILRQHGRDAVNLSGGYALYQIFSQGDQNGHGKG
jgi:NADPH-dependent 2,4-dienoyl-CoA reductase/sulfur reductase-like enzyme/rhodanese-related sulfurtransferase